MIHGITISDLHLFTQRSDDNLVCSAMKDVTKDTRFFVLNGDIIDFRWSCHASAKDTIKAGLNWLENLCSSNPHCTFYYIMGNHDCSQEWAHALDTLKSDKFHWSPTHFRIGDSLFFHGDLPLRGKDPFIRDIPEHSHAIPAKRFMNALYDIAIQTNIHRVFSELICTPKACASKIHSALDTFKNQDSLGARHVYFGHTHAPFSNYIYKNVTYHNTGSAIRRLDINATKAHGHA